LVRPIAQALSGLRIFDPLVRWLARLGPYPTLALFLVPLIVLEPVKPIGAYLMAIGHLRSGILLIAFGELLKVTIVERLFHFSRDKLMSIPALAWSYDWVMSGVAYLRSQPVWRAASRQVALMRKTVHRFLPRIRIRRALPDRKG